MSSPKAITREPVTHSIVERKFGDLWIDENVQRALKKSRAEKMAKEFDPDAIGVITTSYRSPKRIHIVDGQHRYEAIRIAKFTGIIQTNEYHGLTIPEEAALFRKLNTAQNPSAIDKFLLACVEQDPSAVSLAAVLTVNGWSVAGYNGEGKLSAIGSLQRVHALDPEAAERTMYVLTKAWGHRPSAVQGSMVEGLGRMLARYGTKVDLDDLAHRLAGFPGGPDGLVGNARGFQVARSGNLWPLVARVIVNKYNERRRTTKIDNWD